MWGVLAALAKPLFSFAFGTPKAAKTSIVILAIVLFGGAIWYITDQYSDMELRNAALTHANEEFEVAQAALQQALADQAVSFAKQQEQTDAAIRNQAELSNKILKLQEERTNEQDIFKRKSKTFQDMLDRRGETIIKLANRGTERMRIKWSKEINDISNRLQAGASSMLASPEDKEPNATSN